MTKLFSEFKSVSKLDWLHKVEKDLKGKSLESLNWEWHNFQFSPFHNQEGIKRNNKALSLSNQWQIHQDIIVADVKDANKMAITALEMGCNSLGFLANDFSLVEATKLLDGIQLEWVAIQFIGETTGGSFSTKVESLIKKQEYDINKIRIASNNKISINTYNPTIIINTDKSTSIDSDLIVLSHALELNNISKIIKIGADDHYYGNICRLRAMKKILSKKDIKAKIQVDISPSNAMNDTNYRFIQSNAQAMSAISGGADIINIVSNENNEFQNRINRNINHLLQLESYMSRVGDPAAGSYFFEEMTDKIFEYYISKLDKE